ncbi:hypothetical protein FWG95_00345 [Candidatus Saccharibacteria bacterium]|nr:hypothetical protein [Candidatus Saccharibacteria bacterium]
MTAQEYILFILEQLKKPRPLQYVASDKLEETILAKVLSKKFRKYSASQKLIERIEEAIRLNVENGKPINLTFMHGLYKLWRLDEAPEADWAELFALMYYVKWLKPICEIYEPGVWLDMYADDTIQKRINNLTDEEVSEYLRSYKDVLDFLKQYLPDNFKITITKTSDQFGGEANMDKMIDAEVASTELPELNDSVKRTVEMNVRLLPGQDKDPLWRGKVKHLHGAAMTIKRNGEYAYRENDKILFFAKPVPIPPDLFLAVGTTKNSIVSFWTGVGALKLRGDSFEMTILSPNQLAKTKLVFEPISIKGLTGKNFSKIRVIDGEG